jgi:hypothetical protein
MITIGVREKVKLSRVEVKTIGMRCKVGLGESRKKRSFLQIIRKMFVINSKPFFSHKIA